MTLQERLETIRSSPVPKNEASAKAQILVPILQSLDWDPSEMLHEHAVGETRRRGRVDIALKTHGRIVALIEAKAPGTNLEDHVDQILDYADHDGFVDICVLTSGLEWWLYLPRARGRRPERRFAFMQVMEDPSEQLAADLTTFLSRETIVSGHAQEQAEARLDEIQLNKKVPSIWKQMLQEPDDELAELLQRRVQEKAHLRLASKQVEAALQGSPIPSAAVPAASPEPPSLPTHSSSQPAKRKKPRASVKPTAIELWGERHPVGTHIGVMRKFVDLLCERHPDDFDRVLEVRGRRYPHAARDPETLAPSYPRHEPMSSGIFVALSNEPEDIKRRVGRLLKCVDHDASDFRVLYD